MSFILSQDRTILQEMSGMALEYQHQPWRCIGEQHAVIATNGERVAVMGLFAEKQTCTDLLASLAKRLSTPESRYRLLYMPTNTAIMEFYEREGSRKSRKRSDFAWDTQVWPEGRNASTSTQET